MRALFLVPPCGYNARNLPIDRVYGCNYGFDYKPPIHLLQAATYARDRLDWDVRLLDCPAEGMDVAAFEAWAREASFDVVLHWTTYLSAVEDLTAAAFCQREMKPAPRPVFMGAGSTWRPEEFRVADETFLLLGEPEATLAELAARWAAKETLEGVDGLGWWDAEGKLRLGDFRPLLDVSELPMPDRRLLTGKYRANRLDVAPITSMVVSRGCGFKCNFCTPNAVDQAIELEFKRLQAWYVHRPPLRKRTVDQVVAELEDIASLGYKAVEIADNIFTWGKERTLEICTRIAPLGLQWICLARANMLHDDETVSAMARAGCKMIYMGSESFDDGLLQDMAKQIKVADVRRAVATCRRHGIEPEVSVLIGGSPKETWTTLYRSWRAARSLGTRFVHFSVALPAPSTELYDLARAGGWFADGDFYPADNAREVIVNLPNLSATELRAALKLSYALQYLAPRSFAHHLRAVRTPADLVDKARAAARLFGYLAEIRDPARTGSIPPGRVTPHALLEDLS